MVRLPPYRLQVLLDLRERAERQAQEAFAAAQGRLRQVQAEQRALEEQIEQMAEDRRARRERYRYGPSGTVGEGLRVADQAGALRYLDRLLAQETEQRERLQRQGTAVDAARREVQRTRGSLNEAARHRQALENHRERWGQAERKRLLDREESRLDEIAQTVHRHHSRD